MGIICPITHFIYLRIVVAVSRLIHPLILLIGGDPQRICKGYFYDANFSNKCEFTCSRIRDFYCLPFVQSEEFAPFVRYCEIVLITTQCGHHRQTGTTNTESTRRRRQTNRKRLQLNTDWAGWHIIVCAVESFRFIDVARVLSISARSSQIFICWAALVVWFSIARLPSASSPSSNCHTRLFTLPIQD